MYFYNYLSLDSTRKHNTTRLIWHFPVKFYVKKGCVTLSKIVSSKKTIKKENDNVSAWSGIYALVAIVGFVLFEICIYSFTQSAFDSLIGDILFFLLISGIIIFGLGYLFMLMGFTKVTMFVYQILLVCIFYGVPYLTWIKE